MRERQGMPVVYVHGPLPVVFKNQVMHLWREAAGCYTFGFFGNPVWIEFIKHITEEHGLPPSNVVEEGGLELCEQYLREAATDKALDLIEIVFRYIDKTVRGMSKNRRDNLGITISPEVAIKKLNKRFLEHDLGYQFTNGKIVRVGSHFIHQEAIVPMLTLIHERGFKGAEDEFMKAHENYRNGDYEGTLVELCKSLESTLKIICDRKGWQHPPTATAKSLLEIVFKNNLVPSELQSHFRSLRSMIESGTPTLRNQRGGHGGGQNTISVPEHLVSYAINMTASTILFLVTSAEE